MTHPAVTQPAVSEATTEIRTFEFVAVLVAGTSIDDERLDQLADSEFSDCAIAQRDGRVRIHVIWDGLSWDAVFADVLERLAVFDLQVDQIRLDPGHIERIDAA